MFVEADICYNPETDKYEIFFSSIYGKRFVYEINRFLTKPSLADISEDIPLLQQYRLGQTVFGRTFMRGSVRELN